VNSGVPISSPAARAEEQPSVSGGRLWSGRILAALVALFLLFNGIAKVMKGSALLAASVRLGLSESLVPTGVARLLSTILDMIPRTSILVAIRLSGYLGGLFWHAGVPWTVLPPSSRALVPLRS
jgi:hypothetical protein